MKNWLKFTKNVYLCAAQLPEYMKRRFLTFVFALMLSAASLMQAADTFVTFQERPTAVAVYPSAQGALQLVVDAADYPGVLRAAHALQSDVLEVCGTTPMLVTCGKDSQAPAEAFRIVIGSQDKSSLIQQLIKRKAIDGKLLKGMREKYIITLLDASLLDKGQSGQMLIVAGSDKRGTEYGIYELSRQLGVSPWAWWADMPVLHRDSIFVLPGIYTDGEPTVQYRGLFLNDEAPCLSGWVKEKFPDKLCQNLPVDANGETYARGFNHLFYEHVFELLLRLKGNYLWPAMWGNAFYYDDPLNGPLADEMGIIMGTSHHEPMARNHQEWVRYKWARMHEAGAHNDDDAPAEARWDYEVNQPVIDKFFREGMERAKGTEDLITIGMRGDGDTRMGGKEGHDDEGEDPIQKNKRLLEKIIANQRQIIADVTGKKADKTPQMWALYKEVQTMYDLGLDVPDDVLIMLCDDNWGDIRRVPEGNVSALRSKASLLNRKGGWGMYYHVDYVGAPRNTKWANVTNPYHLWEQMRLCYEYGIDRLWILNVGDLKPMEQPIDLFMKMAWRPEAYVHDSSVQDHMLDFCTQLMGNAADASECARLMQTYLQYNSRCTPEMLDCNTYSLATGEWERVMLQYKALEADALNLWNRLQQQYPANNHQSPLDAYHQLVLYPIQSMANLYEMYYAQAENHYLAQRNDAEANVWADRVEHCFSRDAALTADYHGIGGGKWNHLMDQIHIGYTSWQQPDAAICPAVTRVGAPVSDGCCFTPSQGYVSIEAQHYYRAENSQDGAWTVLPTLGRTKSAVALLPHDAQCEGASLTYAINLDGQPRPDSIRVHVVTNSTLPFLRKEGHRYTVQVNDAAPVEQNYNSRYVEEHVYEMYAVVATRVIETVTTVPMPADGDIMTVTIRPVDPGLVVEKVVVDMGGYTPQRLFGIESTFKR